MSELSRHSIRGLLNYTRENEEACRSWAIFYKESTDKLFDVLFATERLLKTPNDKKLQENLRKEVLKFNKWWGR